MTMYTTPDYPTRTIPAVPVSPPPPAAEAPAPVVIRGLPLPVDLWPSTLRTVMVALFLTFSLIQTLAAIVFLFLVYDLYQAIGQMQESLQQWQGIFG